MGPLSPELSPEHILGVPPAREGVEGAELPGPRGGVCSGVQGRGLRGEVGGAGWPWLIPNHGEREGGREPAVGKETGRTSGEITHALGLQPWELSPAPSHTGEGWALAFRPSLDHQAPWSAGHPNGPSQAHPPPIPASP